MDSFGRGRVLCGESHVRAKHAALPKTTERSASAFAMSRCALSTPDRMTLANSERLATRAVARTAECAPLTLGDEFPDRTGVATHTPRRR